MFDDTLVLHKNMNNVFQLTITDRDRVRLKIDEDSFLQVKFRIIDEDDVVVSSTYLDSKKEGDFWETIIPKDEVNKLHSGEGYRFAVTLYQEDAGGNYEEEPLYVDHNFKLMGYAEVHDNFFDIRLDEYVHTEPVIDHFRDEEYEFDAKHFFTHTIFNDGNIQKIEIVNTYDSNSGEDEGDNDDDNDSSGDSDCVGLECIVVEPGSNPDPEDVPMTPLEPPIDTGDGSVPMTPLEPPIDTSIPATPIVPIRPTRCYVTLERNTQTHYPIEPNNNQWTPVATFYGIGQDETGIDFSKIPLKNYGRVIIHTKYPEDYKLVIHKIDR